MTNTAVHDTPEQPSLPAPKKDHYVLEAILSGIAAGVIDVVAHPVFQVVTTWISQR
ncbi:hypothetical protein OHA09_36230 [Streptomyces longwoodensis]|uniref:hypothetical protein n=1 Tax=Streptomyces longwoodensis TaxID=68231 RepID=UPI002E81B57E|nr:hypothetical protein [Streptomyces longwoodensis]WUC55717.1 hypothetical protein OHA09_00740 [Streptomyces longwoodensis]WUC62163.1 hypothetical protein OHA09_36230 [Streptomyces longwoodensis]